MTSRKLLVLLAVSVFGIAASSLPGCESANHDTNSSGRTQTNNPSAGSMNSTNNTTGSGAYNSTGGAAGK